MTGSWRPLVLMAALYVTLGTSVASAQTVIVRHAPAGAAVEIVRNSAPVGSGTVDARGDATIATKMFANAQEAETDAHIFVDACDKQLRVLLIERGLQPQPPAADCKRHEITGWFVMRRVTTLVVDVTGAASTPTVWLRQGAVPSEWLGDDPRAVKAVSTAPTGLVLSGGGGLLRFSEVVNIACGSVVDCEGSNSRLSYTVGAAYWLNRYLGAEVNFLKPTDVSVLGSENNFRFESTLDAQIVTLAAKVGAPFGAVRVYGQGGVNYHRALFTTTQTIDETTVTVDDVTTTIPGGTQELQMETRGWGWLFGGGLEGWVTPKIGIYAEGGVAKLKGNAVGGGEGALDDRAMFIVAGIRVHVGG